MNLRQDQIATTALALISRRGLRALNVATLTKEVGVVPSAIYRHYPSKGAVLDSARFRYLLSQHCGVDVHNIHAYILGEHGDSEFAAWSMTNMAGMPIEQFCRLCLKCDNWQAARRKEAEEVKHSAYHIIDYKGATWFAVGLALTRIAEAILRNQNSVLTVSAVLEGKYGLNGVSLGVPCVLSQKGVEKVLQVILPPDEQSALVKSAAILREAMEQLELTAAS